MNPNAPNPSFELPNPQQVQGSEFAASPLEHSAAGPEAQTMPPVSQPSPVQALTTPLQPVQQVSSTTDDTSSLQTLAPAAADDADLIEKEWVVKAKQIVAATQDDPHRQNKEISRFRADYLKKRYNKDIKLEEN